MDSFSLDCYLHSSGSDDTSGFVVTTDNHRLRIVSRDRIRLDFAYQMLNQKLPEAAVLGSFFALCLLHAVLRSRALVNAGPKHSALIRKCLLREFKGRDSAYRVGIAFYFTEALLF